jgi:adenosylhomocysteine nucleosidase
MAAGTSSFAQEPVTAIVAAMEEEIAPTRARLVDQRTAPIDGARVTLGRLAGAPVALVVTGDGERNARRGLASTLAGTRVARVIVAGVAGGLSDDLDVGGLLLADAVVDEHSGDVLAADVALADIVARACAVRRGVAVTALRIADTADEKRRLLALAGARTGAGVAPARPAVVDLESASFAAAARRAGIPWLVVRAVSDTAGEPVPALLNRSRDAGGAVRRGRVVLGLLTDPAAVRSLLTLRERVRTCAAALARELELAIEALWTADVAQAAANHLTNDPSHTLERRHS